MEDMYAVPPIIQKINTALQAKLTEKKAADKKRERFKSEEVSTDNHV